jgi:hypothetical protein
MNTRELVTSHHHHHGQSTVSEAGEVGKRLVRYKTIEQSVIWSEALVLPSSGSSKLKFLLPRVDIEEGP